MRAGGTGSIEAVGEIAYCPWQMHSRSHTGSSHCSSGHVVGSPD